MLPSLHLNLLFIMFRSSPFCVVAHTIVSETFLSTFLENIAISVIGVKKYKGISK